MFKSQTSQGEPAFHTLIENYQSVIQDIERCSDKSDPRPGVFFSFYAMKSAFLLVKVAGGVKSPINQPDLLPRNRPGSPVDEVQTPKLSDVRRVSNSVVSAYESGDHDLLLRSLQEIGVFELCPSADEQLERMAKLSLAINGSARLMLLVELVRFASELRDYAALRSFLQDARKFEPRGWELYNLCMAEGLLFLDSGDWTGAIGWLEKSTDACLTDGQTCLMSGLRAPDFRLADELLKGGYRVPVLKHLKECQGIWRRRWMPMSDWIESIEHGVIPDMLDSGTVACMNLPSCRAFLQWSRAQALAAGDATMQISPRAKSRREVNEERMKLAEEGKKLLNESIKKWLNREIEGIDIPEPGQPE